MRPAAPSGLVLVADGEKAVRILARIALESNGWRVIEAASADDAARLGLAHHPRVAVLVAGIDGFDVAAALAATKETAVVFVAASREAKARAEQLDAPFLQKPFNPVALVNAVEQAAQRQGKASSPASNEGKLEPPLPGRRVLLMRSSGATCSKRIEVETRGVGLAEAQMLLGAVAALREPVPVLGLETIARLAERSAFRQSRCKRVASPSSGRRKSRAVGCVSPRSEVLAPVVADRSDEEVQAAGLRARLTVVQVAADQVDRPRKRAVQREDLEVVRRRRARVTDHWAAVAGFAAHDPRRSGIGEARPAGVGQLLR